MLHSSITEGLEWEKMSPVRTERTHIQVIKTHTSIVFSHFIFHLHIVLSIPTLWCCKEDDFIGLKVGGLTVAQEDLGRNCCMLSKNIGFLLFCPMRPRSGSNRVFNLRCDWIVAGKRAVSTLTFTSVPMLWYICTIHYISLHYVGTFHSANQYTRYIPLYPPNKYKSCWQTLLLKEGSMHVYSEFGAGLLGWPSLEFWIQCKQNFIFNQP